MVRVHGDPRSPRILEVRPLEEADLEFLRLPVARRSVKLRDAHHNIARLLATGMKLHEVAAATGYSIARISILRSDPAVAELIAKYRDIVTEEWREHVDHVQELGIANTVKAMRQVSEVLDRADEEDVLLPVKDLMAIASDGLDRFGYGKKTQQTNINIDFAAKLEAARVRVEQLKKIA